MSCKSKILLVERLAMLSEWNSESILWVTVCAIIYPQVQFVFAFSVSFSFPFFIS